MIINNVNILCPDQLTWIIASISIFLSMGLNLYNLLLYRATLKPSYTKPTGGQLLCSEKTGVLFMKVKLKRLDYLKFSLYRIPGSGFLTSYGMVHLCPRS